MLNYQSIPQFPRASYSINVGWEYLEKQIELSKESGLDLDPPFQRAHVWTEEQQRRYVEYCLRGGETSRTLLFNCPDWHDVTAAVQKRYVIVDGKQRLEAVRKFMRNQLKVFGEYRDGFTGWLRITTADFIWKVCAVELEEEVLQLYLDINTAGTPHTDVEIEKVRAMMERLRK